MYIRKPPTIHVCKVRNSEVEVVSPHEKYMDVPTQIYPFDASVKGDVQNFKACPEARYLVALFFNGSTTIYDLKKQTLLKEVDAHPKA